MRALPTTVISDLTDGVYAPMQAEAGERLWAQECADCHEAVNYTGTNFTARWAGGTLSDVYQDLSLSMPPARPAARAERQP